MAKSRIQRVAREFEQALQMAVACITTSVLVPRHDEPGKSHRLLLNPPARVDSAAGTLEIRIVHSYAVVPDAGVPTGYRISTDGYFYDLARVVRDGGEQERRGEILAYHWSPESTSGDPAYPHLHVYRSDRIERLHISKMHLPTGHVTLEDFIRLLITEFNVTVRRENWPEILMGSPKNNRQS